ncbi:hypothetical protein [Bacillus sp. T33-2]|uniref:hypothetical protein n=1 Tax=Bacillus sp. T33-2 TaxID=2054168 RepID=UPI000C7775AD|nr:hypothetical protein [Bacillus sp. T33-2]PLR96867.1 hypothetical protein CVD19_09735 [Bacillus sp. T33-2]
MYPYYFYRVSWDNVLSLLRQSLFAEEMVCAMSSELFHIPQTQNLQGNREMHNHLVPASYHRVTATGSAQRLKNGEQRQSVVETLAACIINASAQDQQVREGLAVMYENADTEFKPFIQLIIRWQQQAESYLEQAKEASRSIGVSFPDGGEQQNG